MVKKYLANIRDVIIAAIFIILLHVSALISLISLIIEKVFEYLFTFLLWIVFLLLLLCSTFQDEYTQSWSDIRIIWKDFVDLVYCFDYQDLKQWYKDVFLKKNKKKEKVVC